MSYDGTRLKRLAVLHYAVAFVLAVIGLTLTISNWNPEYYQFFKDFAGPSATVTAAGAAALITFHFGRVQAQIAQQQADLAAIRLQHDLFDRRFEIYEACQTLLNEVLINGNISDEKFDSFFQATRKVVFLFDQDITDYIEMLRISALQLRGANKMIADPTIKIALDPTPPRERTQELYNLFLRQFDVSIAKFKPFLALDKNTAIHATYTDTIKQ
jgi:hypothetical protein